MGAPVWRRGAAVYLAAAGGLLSLAAGMDLSRGARTGQKRADLRVPDELDDLNDVVETLSPPEELGDLDDFDETRWSPPDRGPGLNKIAPKMGDSGDFEAEQEVPVELGRLDGLEGGEKAEEEPCAAVLNALKDEAAWSMGGGSDAGLRDDLTASFQTCESMGGGEASRSGATFQRTRDQKYIVKRIKSSESAILRKTFDNMWHRDDSLLLPIVVSAGNTVVMRNLQFPGTSGLPKAAEFKDLLDVKPIREKIKNPDLPNLFQVASNLDLDTSWEGFSNVSRNLAHTLDFLRRSNLVDYSLCVVQFDVIPFGPMSSTGGHCIRQPSCPSHSCAVLCFWIIDYLMEFTFWRQLESWIKADRWADYAKGMKHLWFTTFSSKEPQTVLEDINEVENKKRPMVPLGDLDDFEDQVRSTETLGDLDDFEDQVRRI